jgi:hypothetical protein
MKLKFNIEDYGIKFCKRHAGRCQPGTSLEAPEKRLGHHEAFLREEK